MSSSTQILIVEDNETNLMIFTDILTAAGYEVLSANSAEDCFQLLKDQDPRLILMDIQLPGMDGLEAVRCLKKDPDTASLPVVALTAHAMAGHRKKALEVGCCGYITKPIRSREFREKVKLYLEGKQITSGEVTHDE